MTYLLQVTFNVTTLITYEKILKIINKEVQFHLVETELLY